MQNAARRLAAWRETSCGQVPLTGHLHSPETGSPAPLPSAVNPPLSTMHVGASPHACLTRQIR